MSSNLSRRAVDELFKLRASTSSTSASDNVILSQKNSKTISKTKTRSKLPPTKHGLKKIKERLKRTQLIKAAELEKEAEQRINPLDKVRQEQEERNHNLERNLKYFTISRLESTAEKELKKKILNLQAKKYITAEAELKKSK